VKRFSIAIVIASLLNSCLWAEGTTTSTNKASVKESSQSKYNIRELALPSEVEKLGKQSGSIYYSPSVKGKVLIPVHMWGEVRNSGLHFVPLDTNLLNGISLAGGPTSAGDLADVQVTTTREGKRERLEFDLSNGGNLGLEDFKLKPGDTVFVKKDTYLVDRAYYTSLIGVAVTILSSVLIYKRISRL